RQYQPAALLQPGGADERLLVSGGSCRSASSHFSLPSLQYGPRRNQLKLLQKCLEFLSRDQVRIESVTHASIRPIQAIVLTILYGFATVLPQPLRCLLRHLVTSSLS